MLGRAVVAAEATGFPAMLMIVGMLGVLLAIGIAIGGNRRRGLRVAAVAALLFAFGLLIANFDDDGGGSTPDSLTPRITSTHRPDLEPYLLTAEDLAEVPSLAGAQVSDLDDVELFEDPDPRGPCGSPTVELPTSGAAGRAFNRDGLQVVQMVLEGPAAVEYLESDLADLREPCGPYDSRMNTGDMQHVEGIEAQRVDEGDGYILTALVRTPQGRGAFSGAAVRVEDRVAFLFGIGFERMPDSDLLTIVDLLRERLA